MATDTKNTALATRLEAQAEAPDDISTKGSTVLAMIRDPKIAQQLKLALPNQLTAERFLRLLLTECRQEPKLFACTPESFMAAVFDMAAVGLEPGPLGQAYLVPFRNRESKTTEVTLILGYKGLKELAYRAGTVDLIDAVSVHEGEPFQVIRGSDARIEHEERRECAENEIIAYYAIAYPKGGGRPVFDVMWPSDIEKIRKRSRAATSGPWVTDPEAMSQKTVTRRLLNRGKVRLTPEIAEAIERDEARELGYAPKLDAGVDEALARDAAKQEAAEREAERKADAEQKTKAGKKAEAKDEGRNVDDRIHAAEAAQEATGAPPPTETEPIACKICGATDIHHDKAKHDAWAVEERKKKEAEGKSEDPGRAFRS